MLEKRKSTASNLKNLDTLKDEEIDYSDISELDESFFKRAILVEPKTKQSLTIRYDKDVVDFFKKTIGKGYQTKINAVLRAYMDHCQRYNKHHQRYKK